MELDVKLEKWVPEHEEKDSEKLKNESVPYIVPFGNLAWYSEDCYRKKADRKMSSLLCKYSIYEENYIVCLHKKNKNH